MTPPPLLLHELLDRAAAARPDAPAVSHGRATLTYGQLERASRQIAGWLADRGVRRGDRVLLALPPDPLVPALLYGCSRAGAAFIVAHERSPAALLAHLLGDAEPALVVTDEGDAQRIAAERGVATASSAQLREGAETGPVPAAPPPVLAVDPVCLIYTSGSTGMPKAVVSTHAQVTFAAAAIQSQLRYRDDDVVYCQLPLSFDYGMYQIFLATLAGAHLCLDSGAVVGPRLLTNLHDTGATVLPAVPALAEMVLRMLSRRGARPPRLRLLTNTGAAMPDGVIAALRERIPGMRVQLMYGLTECKRAAIMPEDGDLARPGACGRALPGTELFTVDAAGERLPAGEVGEIVVRGPHVMAGYWRRPALTAERFRRVDGLFPQLHTGDHGWLDEDGYLYFAGRRDDLYKERGFRVSVTEVEAAAHRVAGVRAAAVLAPGGGRDGATLFAVTALPPHEVLTRLRTELEEFKAPRHCVVVTELPLTRNQKVDRPALAELWEDRTDVQ